MSPSKEWETLGQKWKSVSLSCWEGVMESVSPSVDTFEPN